MDQQTNTQNSNRKSWVFPGQGSQAKGMGEDLWDAFPELVSQADEILGYSIKQLCLHDPEKQLNQTQYTQPALYVVNALSFYRQLRMEAPPDFVAGHSLGEYSALLAAGAIDFQTGLRLVQKRGQLMSEACGGGMAAVLNLALPQLRAVLAEQGLDEIDIANYNTPSQIVVSGKQTDIHRLSEILNNQGTNIHLAGEISNASETVRCVPLPVSGAFHSRYMQTAQAAFAEYLQRITFAEPSIPVISNVTARPHSRESIADNLAKQITQQVNWVGSIRYLIGQGVSAFTEIGPGMVLTKLVAKIQAEASPPVIAEQPAPQIESAMAKAPAVRSGSGLFSAQSLGSEDFRQAHHCRYAYVIGSMANGIASAELVIRAARAGILAYFGSAGLELEEIETAVDTMQQALGQDEVFGVNVLHQSDEPEREDRLVDLLLAKGVQRIEAAGFTRITPALVKYRLTGLRQDRQGNPIARHNILAKVSRSEAAALFMSSPPANIVNDLLEGRQISPQEAALANSIPMADDVCVEANSGWYGEAGNIAALFPAIQRQLEMLMRSYTFSQRIRLGVAGGIGTPEAAAAAFILGADFILTGSINQCTVEANTSDAVKDILQTVGIRHMEYAPAADLFELGSQAQVVNKGVLFPARAQKLYDLFKHHDSLESIDEITRQEIQEKYFHAGFEAVYRDVTVFYCKHNPSVLQQAQYSPKYKMGLIFKWYFSRAMQAAMQGKADQQANYLIFCSSALGGFNQWVEDTRLQLWRDRHVDDIAVELMKSGAEFLNRRMPESSKVCEAQP